ncbi:MAG: GntR family transcriptional regulator [Alphaproteobacteria bacterium]|nr:GntR family transcriptional regulator [Alphaproteobacteria bacterium]
MTAKYQSFSPAALAYARIKDSILNRTYGPGQRLSETMLAAELKLGRSPIRTALTRLESEGWIRIQPQSGTFVSAPTLAELAEMAELRLVLEIHAARQAASRIDDVELARLRAAFEVLAATGVDGHFADFQAFDDDFHATVHLAAGNRKIFDMLRNLRDQIRWVRSSTAILPGRVAESLREMQRVLEALERRDGEAAAKAMGMHISNIASSFKSMRDAEAESAA